MGRLTGKERDALPNYVVVPDWMDPHPDPLLGPRQHPYGMEAWSVLTGGEYRVYRDKEAAFADGPPLPTPGVTDGTSDR